MSSGDLETALRDCLDRQAARPAAPADFADVAVRRATRIRRQRVGASAVALVLVTALAAAGVVRMGTGSGGRPYGPDFVGLGSDQPPASDPDQPALQYAPDPVTLSGTVAQEPMAKAVPPPVDVVVAGQLRTPAGNRISLAAVGAVAQAYRATEGWLVVGVQAGDASLWRVAEAGQPRQLLSGVERLVLAADGRRVAWRADAHFYVGAVAGDKIETRYESPAPGDGAPIGFVGDGVLLATRTGGRHDVWWPDRGPYEPTWRRVPGVYGALPDGRTVVAQVPGGSTAQPCLALLDAAAGFAVRKRACDVPLNPGSVGWLSPDGRWLVAEGALDAAVLIDLADAFGDRRPAINAGPGPYGQAVWIDKRTLVHAGPGRQLVRLRLDRLAAGQRGGVEHIPVPDAAASAEPMLVVPRLGA